MEDKHTVWFGCERKTRAEGRAAARRGRNEILLIPCPIGGSYHYPRVTIITCKPIGLPLHRANLTGGTSQLIVISDESQSGRAQEDCSRFGERVEFAHLQLPSAEFPYHYRCVATIVLAEISRQVGRRALMKAPTAQPRPPIYKHALEQLAQATGELVRFEQLLDY